MTTISESQWVNYFGFQRFPFDRPESGNEEFARPDFLASCFVEPEGFERVFGQADAPVTSILFAARGTGKTACRVMMDYYCRNGQARLNSPQSDESSYVLSVPHIHLDHVLEIARRSNPVERPEIRVEHHAEEIMKQAVPAFVDLIARNDSFAEQTRKLSRGDFEDLSLFLIHYSVYLSSNQQDYLRDINIIMPPITEPMKGLVGQSAGVLHPPSWEGFLYHQRLNASPLQHLQLWASLVRKIGIHATYALVDGVDELVGSAGDARYAHSLIQPLLTTLRLMDGTHYFALKFFLPSDVEQHVISDPDFRKDRGFVIRKLIWQKPDLVNILRERLNALRRPDYEIRDRTAAGFDALCVPELRGQIEQDIAELARGNPRHLMNICSFMVTAHCQRDVVGQDDPYQINQEDFTAARELFDSQLAAPVELAQGIPIDLRTLIEQGENETLEIKSSMRYDYKRNDLNKDELGLEVARTIAGFMNHIGGILIIGVGDDGQILGIEKDIETLSKKSLDGFQLAFKDIVKKYLGMEHLVRVHLFFENIEERSVCVLQMEASPSPVYVKVGDDNEFYVRSMNSTIKYSLPQTVSYIRSRWG